MDRRRVNRGIVEERRSAVYRMRVEGMTFAQIGAELQISHTTAHRDFEEAVNEIPIPYRAHVRIVAHERYEYLFHELRSILRMRGLEPAVRAQVADCARKVVTDSVKMWGAVLMPAVDVRVHQVDAVDVEFAEVVAEAQAAEAIKRREIEARREAS